MDSASSSDDAIDQDLTNPVVNDDNCNNDAIQNDATDSSPPKKPKGLGKRHILALLGFWGFAMIYAIRFNLAICIVAMSKSREAPPPSSNLQAYLISTLSPPFFESFLNGKEDILLPPEELILPNESVQSGQDPSREPLECNQAEEEALIEELDENEDYGEFDWDENDQAMILSSFFWGYVTTQLPGGVASTKFGGKWLLGIGILINGLFTLLIPLAARTNIYMLIYVRFVQGLAQGVIFPAMQTIFAAWAPPQERSILSAIAYSGCSCGAAVTMICSGYLIKSSGGWPSVFYFTGLVTILFSACWLYFIYDTPSSHPTISPEERDFICNSIGALKNAPNVRNKTPWRKIFTSIPILAIAVAQFGNDWGLYTLLNGLPTYLKTILHFDMKQNSWLSATPYFLHWAFTNFISYIVDKLIAKRCVKTLTIRRVCHAIAEIGSAFAIIGAILVGCNRTGIVALLTMAVGLSGATCGSFLPNQIEIAPNYAGIIMGITNTVANIAGFSTVLVVGALTENQPTQRNWMYVFIITIALYLVTAIFYIIFVSSEEQSWNRSDPQADPLIGVQTDIIISPPPTTASDKDIDNNYNIGDNNNSEEIIC